jgi:hypothetical protein
MIEFIEFPALGALVAFGVTIIGLVIATKQEQQQRERERAQREEREQND